MGNSGNIVVVVKGVILYTGKMLMVQRSLKDQIGGGTWECPGGKIEFGEELEEALMREIKEETGIEVKVDRILYGATMKTEPSRQLVILTYLCKSKTNTVILSHEHIAYKWATKEEAKVFLSPGIIQDFSKNHLFLLSEWQ